jgi:uncharacterized repeat protein (TIGR03803 family)
VKKRALAVTPVAPVTANHRKAKLILKGNVFLTAIFVLALAVTMPSAQAQTFHVLHEFNGGDDGAHPQGGLVRDAAGNLYGMTISGGVEGVVYKIDAAKKETVIFTFQGNNGEGIDAALIQDQAGNLYGIADGGPGAGMVFKLSQEGVETQLFDFQGGLGIRKPQVPVGGILMDQSGSIFGATYFGGHGNCQFSCGSLFRLDTADKLHVLHNFSGGSDGSRPFGPLVQDAEGNLYGVAQQGGNLSCPGFPSEEFQERGCGTVFKISKSNVLTVLHAFAGGSAGAIPASGLLLDAAGNIYGTTIVGGTSDLGTVFKISKDGTYTVLHRFNGADGSRPNGSLVADSAGNLYGTTQWNGAETLGRVFKLSTTGKLKVLHRFTGGKDGATPTSGVILDEKGNIYGTASKNFLIQQVQGGNVFEITP